MATPPRPWTWRRWQLVHVEHSGNELVVDAVELPDSPAEAPHLITFAFAAPKRRRLAERELRRLTRWIERDDGLCDACLATGDGAGHLTLVQDGERVVVASSGGAHG